MTSRAAGTTTAVGGRRSTLRRVCSSSTTPLVLPVCTCLPFRRQPNRPPSFHGSGCRTCPPTAASPPTTTAGSSGNSRPGSTAAARNSTSSTLPLVRWTIRSQCLFRSPRQFLIDAQLIGIVGSAGPVPGAVYPTLISTPPSLPIGAVPPELSVAPSTPLTTVVDITGRLSMAVPSTWTDVERFVGMNDNATDRPRLSGYTKSGRLLHRLADTRCRRQRLPVQEQPFRASSEFGIPRPMQRRRRSILQQRHIQRADANLGHVRWHGNTHRSVGDQPDRPIGHGVHRGSTTRRRQLWFASRALLAAGRVYYRPESGPGDQPISSQAAFGTDGFNRVTSGSSTSIDFQPGPSGSA